jgi:hypothetical protein
MAVSPAHMLSAEHSPFASRAHDDGLFMLQLDQ